MLRAMKIGYDPQEAEWKRVLEDPGRQRVGESWLAGDSLDAWRHARMRRFLRPLIESGRAKSWVTVGDGRFGTDAHHLMAAGLTKVMATDLSDELLKAGAARGFIKDFCAQNAEALTFADDSFDFAYCKEAYHHFPRPYLAVYEMLRVCREGVVFTEPNDPVARPYRLFTFLKKILGKRTDGHFFEPIGNYIYAMSEREVEKLLLGIGLRYCAFAYCNDYYIEGVEHVPAVGGTPRDRKTRAKLKGVIAAKDLLGALGLRAPDLITAVLFKRKPSDAILSAMRSEGFAVRELPENPYV
jgi:SAM-dependent methyltransferase